MSRSIKKGLGTTSAAVCALSLAIVAWAHDPDNRFKRMDSNGDGMISASEHAAAVRTMFDEMDSNHDGMVTAAEMDAHHKAMESREHPPGQHGSMDRAEHEGHAAMHGEMSSADKIARMDTNSDGMLSASEHETGAQAMFTEMDTDHNGSLSKQEMSAGHAMMKSKRPEK